ncbi:MAG: threonine/serine exporter family protein, partial [Gemmiger qucibialis]
MTDLAFNLIMDCGQAMLANGGEVFRAQDTMEIMARSFGIVDFHVYVLTNGIFASAQNGTVSAVRHVPVVSTNLGHVEAINAISRRVADGELDLNSAQLEFERMKRMPTLSPLYNCAAGTMGAGCFAMLFGGGLPEMLV